MFRLLLLLYDTFASDTIIMIKRHVYLGVACLKCDKSCTVVRNKSEYGCVFATVISLVLVYSAESSNLRVPENNFPLPALVLLYQAVIMLQRFCF